MQPDQDQTHNLGICPDWGSNLQHFGVWNDGPTNLATQPGQGKTFYNNKRINLLVRHNTYTCI